MNSYLPKMAETVLLVKLHVATTGRYATLAQGIVLPCSDLR